MAVAQHESVEGGWVDLENHHVVEKRFWRVPEIDQNVAHLASTLRFRMHREAPLAVQCGARWRIWGQIGACPPLDIKTIALFRRNELYDLIIRDDPNRESIDLRDFRAERLGFRRSLRFNQRA